MSRFTYYLSRAAAESPRVVLRKAALVTRRELRAAVGRARDARHPTFVDSAQVPIGNLRLRLRHAPVRYSLIETRKIAALSRLYAEHCFDVLGSGWTQVRHGMQCGGVEGVRMLAGARVDADTEGEWLRERINIQNLPEAQRAWRAIAELRESSKRYVPIDWHLDVKSGYRWCEDTWYLDVPFGHVEGVDIKVPWELARMHHLLQFAHGYALANAAVAEPNSGADFGLLPRHIYLREFRDQILDFIATNPPRFGVNWRCTMDVAIRVANWLIAHDLFRHAGAEFDATFNSHFKKSVYEHAAHIATNLEWTQESRGNHYLADIVGLAFAAAYLPSSAETNAWLAYAKQELISESARQFNPDGTNFEGSTGYHRLATELVTFATALFEGLDADEATATSSLRYRPGVKVDVRRGTAVAMREPDAVYFPTKHFERLLRSAQFVMDYTTSTGSAHQIGDNDSGRFLKLSPAASSVVESEVKQFANVAPDLRTLGKEYWLENALDHRHVIASVSALLDTSELNGSGAGIDADVVRALAGPAKRIDATATPDVGLPTLGAQDSDGGRHFKHCVTTRLRLPRDHGIGTCRVAAYPHFGAFFFRTDTVQLAVRCPTVNEGFLGSHGHEDYLSFELAVGGCSIVVDPGSPYYTCFPEMHEQFRSAAVHNAQNNHEPAGMRHRSAGRVARTNRTAGWLNGITANSLQGEMWRGRCGQRRSFDLRHDGYDELVITDASNTQLTHMRWLLGPEVAARREGSSLILTCTAGDLLLESDGGLWTIETGWYSPGYGWLRRCTALRWQAADGERAVER